MKPYAPINPKLSLEVLRAVGRSRQIYPLEANPHGNRNVATDHPVTYWQVRARPQDPQSPVIWGHVALSLVCGGHFTPSKAPKVDDLKTYKPRRVTNGFGEETTSTKPDPRLSSASTTNEILVAMLRAGFTRQECLDTLLRHPLAGGAYLKWMMDEWSEESVTKTLNDWWESKTFLNERTGEVIIIPDRAPRTIQGTNPWGNSLLDLLEEPTLIGLVVGPTQYTHKKTGVIMDIVKARVQEILKSVEFFTNHSLIETSTGIPVVSPTALRSDDSIKFKGPYSSSYLPNVYLPWMVEVGALEVHTDLVKVLDENGKAKARGSVPKTGYALAKDLDLPHLLALWPAPVSVKPCRTFDSEREEVPEPESTPLTMDMIRELLG